MADDAGDFARSMSIATSGLRAQAGRMRVISENIANADSTSRAPAAILTGAKSRHFPPRSIARWMPRS
jgi:flagellar basal body rod protein FlgC